MGGFRRGGEAPGRGLTSPLLRQNEKVASVSAVAGRSLSQFARVNRGSGRAGCRSPGFRWGRIFQKIALETLLGRSWRSLCVVLAPLGPFSALVGRFSAAGGAQEASEEGFWSKHVRCLIDF